MYLLIIFIMTGERFEGSDSMKLIRVLNEKKAAMSRGEGEQEVDSTFGVRLRRFLSGGERSHPLSACPIMNDLIELEGLD